VSDELFLEELCREGVGTGNTTPSTLQKQEKNESTKGGIDFLESSLFGTFEGEAVATFERLEKCQQAARDRNAQAAVFGYFDDDPIVVKPKGVAKGELAFPYALEWQGVTFLVRKAFTANEHVLKVPAVRVSMSGVPLTEFGHVALANRVRRLLVFLGFKTLRETISRVDLCADLKGVSMQAFASHFDFNRWSNSRLVARTVKHHEYWDGDDLETLYVGAPGADIQLRIYDKLKEASRDPFKLELMIARRWNGEIPAAATRVEFQLNRDVLRERFNVDTFEELQQALAGIISWLTNDWFRLVDEVPDRDNRHQDRVALSPLWLEVQAHFASWIGDPGVMPPIKERSAPDPQRLRTLTLGCLSSLVAVMQGSCATVEEARAFVAEIVKQEGGAFVSKVRDKFLRLRASKPRPLLVSG
jgi:hypothetical protein